MGENNIAPVEPPVHANKPNPAAPVMAPKSSKQTVVAVIAIVAAALSTLFGVVIVGLLFMTAMIGSDVARMDGELKISEAIYEIDGNAFVPGKYPQMVEEFSNYIFIAKNEDGSEPTEQTVRGKIKAYEASVDKLEASGVGDSSETKVLLGEMLNKDRKLLAYIDLMMEHGEYTRVVFRECNYTTFGGYELYAGLGSAEKASATFDENMGNCLSSLDRLTKSKDEATAKHAKAQASSLRTMGSEMGAMATSGSTDVNQRLSAAQDEYNSSRKEYIASIKDVLKKLDSAIERDAMSDASSEQSEGVRI